MNTLLQITLKHLLTDYDVKRMSVSGRTLEMEGKKSWQVEPQFLRRWDMSFVFVLGNVILHFASLLLKFVLIFINLSSLFQDPSLLNGRVTLHHAKAGAVLARQGDQVRDKPENWKL